MSKRLESEIREIKDRFGVGLEDLKPDELEMLVVACRRCDSPFSNVNAELCERPVFVSPGLYIWPLTAGAHIWLEEFATAWWKRGTSMFRWAQVYALSHAREPEAFARLDTRWKARAAILKTALRFACYRRELDEAIRKAYGNDKDQVPDTKAETAINKRKMVDFNAMVARLEVHSGLPAKDWLWGKSMLNAAKAYCELSRLVDTFDPKTRPHMKDELDDAINDLARVKVAIARRVRAEREKEAKNEQGA